MVKFISTMIKIAKKTIPEHEEIDSEETGKAVRAIRKQWRVSLLEVSNETGIKTSQLSLMERGKKYKWTDASFKKITRAILKISKTPRI